MTTLEELSEMVVIDEIQRRPDLFELLRSLADSNSPLHVRATQRRAVSAPFSVA
jgi:predicted AAA+ superfamily ATPase